MTSSEKSISRRSFLGLTGAAATITAAAGLYGCAQPASSSGGSLASTKGSAAGPIEAVSAPASWDEEADVVVVGTGGGLAAAAYAAQAGKKVVVLEKASTWGGSSKETDNFSVMGTKTQQAIYQGLAAQMKAAGQDEAAAQFEQMGALDPMVMRAQWKEKFYVKPNGGDVGELPNGEEGPRACAPIQPMLETLTACIPDAIDYMGAVGVSWGPVTEFGSAGFVSGVCPEGSEQGSLIARANYTVFEILYNFCLDQGAVFHFLTPATALVVEDGRVVGVQATGDVSFVKANDGVVLATGGMTFNMDMLEEYVPHVARRCLNSTAASTDEGDGIRMGLGVGGTISGYDSAFIFDGGVDCGAWGRYLYKGDVQFARQPWMLINIKGDRVPYYPVTTLGFTKQAGVHMHNPGCVSYVVCDSHYDEVIKGWEAEGKQQLICRNPITREHWEAAGANVERMGDMVDEDYTIGMREGIEAGYIFEADTIEELGEALGFDADIFSTAVKNWNELCEAGVDEVYSYAPEWLNKVQDPPFYGMKVGGTVLSTMCGLTVDTNMRVLDEKARPIAGLYAAGCTIGGLGGDSTYGDCRNPGGGVAMACGTAYQAARAICGDI